MCVTPDFSVETPICSRHSYDRCYSFFKQEFLMITMTSLDAQNRFGELLDTSQREPVLITRRGRPVSTVISPGSSPKKLQADELTQEQLTTLQAWRDAVLAVARAMLFIHIDYVQITVQRALHLA